MVVWLVFDDLGNLEIIFRNEQKANEYIEKNGNDNYSLESWVVNS